MDFFQIEKTTEEDQTRVEKLVTWGNRIWAFVCLIAIISLVATIVTFILWILYLVNPPVDHVKESYSSSVVELRATSSSDEINFVQPVNFYHGTYFNTFTGTNITANNGTFSILVLTNQTSGGQYDVDAVIELLTVDMGILFDTLGLPVELVDFLTTYAGTSRKRSHSHVPTLPAFLGDALNNITTLQGSLACVNASLNANANYAYYPSTGGSVSVSPSSGLVPIVATGTFAQQVGITLGTNSFTVGKIGLYSIAYNIGVDQPALVNTVQVSLQVSVSAVATSYMSWSGASTGKTYTSGVIIVSLGTSDIVQLSITSIAPGATIDAASTQISIWNIS